MRRQIPAGEGQTLGSWRRRDLRNRTVTGTEYAYRNLRERDEELVREEIDMALPRHPSTGTVLRRARRSAPNDPAVHLTLLELVRTVGEITDDESEIVATVIQMLRSGTVKLAGTFRDEPIRHVAD